MDRQHANKIYEELAKMSSTDVSLPARLGWMATRGSSIVLNYGEDNRQWEVSWITSGNRFTAVRADVGDAVRDVIRAVRDDLLMRFSEFS